MAAEVVGGSFRDPSGFVFFRDGRPYRQVNRRHAEPFDLLMSSGLYEDLVDDGLLLGHEEVGAEQGLTPEAYTVIAPEPLVFTSYPYEWCFSQLKDAALTTLEIQSRALGHGLSLRDASAYNIQFHRGRAVLIDTLSFEAFREGEPWVAYRQFCQHFLAPLALMSRVDVRLSSLLRTNLDGIPVDLASSLLPWTSRLRPGLGLHVGLHARTQRRYERAGNEASESRTGTFSLKSFRGLIESLRATVSKLDWEPPSEGWSAYYADAETYSHEGLDHKGEVVSRFIAEVEPRMAWDLGANTGRFSRMAAAAGADVVAFDSDPGCVESAYRSLRDEGHRSVHPVILDLTNPSPALGWEHRERLSLGERATADLVLALALIHHLVIGNNVPLDRFARFLARLGPWVILEFVPKDDPKVRHMLANREDIFDDYHREGFERAVNGVFEIREVEEIRDSGRVLYLLRRR